VASHDDRRRRLSEKFRTLSRYANFGPLLQSLEIHGFRGISHLTLDITSPITALSGLNGKGKSTIAQLACCAYKKALTASGPRFYVKTFFPVSAADPAPFTPDAQIIYSYCVQSGDAPQQVTVSRKAKEWSGYKRQPDRSCYYVGVNQFIPKIERRDFSVYGGRDLELGSSRPLPPNAADHIGAILGLAYDSTFALSRVRNTGLLYQKTKRGSSILN